MHVIGTTGLEPEDIAKIEAAAHHAVIIRAGNMSLGVNLLVSLTKKVAAALDADWDIEVIEAHHRHKVDAPSGTALMLGQAAAEGRGVKLESAKVSGLRSFIAGVGRHGGFTTLSTTDVAPLRVRSSDRGTEVG